MTTGAITGLTIDKDGTSGGTANMTTAPTLRGSPRIPKQINYGTTVAYGSSTALTTLYGTGATTSTLPATLLSNTLYHWRASATNDAGTFVGADATFTITPPTVTTGTPSNSGATVTLNGTLTSLGNASDTYVYFQYGLTSAYGSTTAQQTLAAPATFTANITHPDYPKDIHYRSVAKIGTSLYYGADTTLSTATAAKAFDLDQILNVLPLLIFVLALLASGALSVWGWKKGNIIVVVLGLVFIAVMIIIYPIIIAGIEGILAFIP
jgi:hypothetical protein